MPRQLEILVPDIGDFTDIPVIEVLVKPGDAVSAEDALVTLESDKATMDVPSPAAGTVERIAVALGDLVSQGALVLTLSVEATQTEPANAAGGPQDPEPEGTSKTGEVAPQAPAPGAGPSPSIVDIKVPDLGDFTDIPVIEVLVKVGDTVAAEDALVTLESDKATMDVPSPVSGIVEAVLVSVGDNVSEGSDIARLRTAAQESVSPSADQTPAQPASAQPVPAATAASTSAAPGARPSPTAALEVEPAQSASKPSHATPGVRRFARELGVDIAQVKGTGRKGRILEADVKRYVKLAVSGHSDGTGAAGGSGIPAMPEIDFSKWGPVEVTPLPRIKRLSGPHLHRAWLNVPHVTNHDEVDITELEAFRQSLKGEATKAGTKLTPLVFIMKALTRALRDFPAFNASLTPDTQNLVYKHYFHIGIAVDTPQGLIVPVVRDVDKKGFMELALELGELSARARDGKLKPGELQGGCISISSLGGIGGIGFTPIVNAPEVAILGVSRSRMSPVWNGTEFTPRLMLPLDLSYDHRVIDGAEAARFLVHLGALLGDLRRLLL